MLLNIRRNAANNHGYDKIRRCRDVNMVVKFKAETDEDDDFYTQTKEEFLQEMKEWLDELDELPCEVEVTTYNYTHNNRSSNGLMARIDICESGYEDMVE